MRKLQAAQIQLADVQLGMAAVVMTFGWAEPQTLQLDRMLLLITVQAGHFHLLGAMLALVMEKSGVALGLALLQTLHRCADPF